MNTLRNLPVDDARQLADLIQVRPRQVVSMALSKSEFVQMTLFAFDKGESVSEEAYFGDTLYYSVEGVLQIVLSGNDIKELSPGKLIMIPAGTLHAVQGKDEFKMLQITIME